MIFLDEVIFYGISFAVTTLFITAVKASDDEIPWHQE